MQENKKKRAAIFFWDGWISVSPSIINTMILLAKNGYEVDCISRYPGYDFAEDIVFPHGINIFRYGKPYEKPIKQATNITRSSSIPKTSIGEEIKKRLGISKLGSNLRRSKKMFDEFSNYISFSKKVTAEHEYDFVIGVDTYGLAAAGISFITEKVNLVYFSLEIRFIKSCLNRTERYIKRLEKYFHKKAAITIIQDTYRLEALCIENGVTSDPKKFVIVPNAPIGKYNSIKSTYFRDMFSLSDEDVIVLHAGGISTGYMNNEIAASASAWPDNWKLIFHLSAFLDPESPGLEKLRELSNNKALFSLNPVPYDKLAEITSSANIGIVFYNKDKGLNHSLIVGASGKLANYLRCGLPVIAMNLPGFKELFNEYGCGIVVDSADENAKAIETILADYETFSKNAARCFDEVYEFESHFNKLSPMLSTLNKTNN